MKLISSDGTVVSNRHLPLIVRALLAAAEAIPDDEGWTTYKIADIVERSHLTVQTCMGHPALNKIKIIVGTRAYWGNEKTIAKEKKSMSK